MMPMQYCNQSKLRVIEFRCVNFIHVFWLRCRSLCRNEVTALYTCASPNAALK